MEKEPSEFGMDPLHSYRVGILQFGHPEGGALVF
jgi:hypothetical protein